MAGWISLHRKVRDHWLYKEKRVFSKFEAWVDLLMEVNHQDNRVLLGNELVEVKRGQTITSMRKLCDRWGWSNTKVKQFLTLLQNDGMMTYKSDTKKTVITIANYEHFQNISDEKTSQNTHGNDTKQTRKHTNNNDNNDNNENKVISTTTGIEPEYGELITIFENNIGMIAGTINEESYYEYYQLLGKDLVVHAIRKATERNKRSFGYVRSILNSWIKANCKTVSDADTFDQQLFSQNKKGVNRIGKPTSDTKKYDFSNITVNTRE